MWEHAFAIATLTLCHIGAARWVVSYSESKREHTRWCAIHAAVNGVIALAAWPSLVATALQPRESLLPPPWTNGETCIPVVLGLWLHAYHAAFYTLSSDDRAHHILYVAILGTPSYIYSRRVTNVMIFFLSGLPGGLIYALVALRRCNVSPFLSWNEPKISAAINLGMRAPGVFFGALSLIRASFTTHDIPDVVLMMQAVLPVINVVYYARQSVIRLGL